MGKRLGPIASGPLLGPDEAPRGKGAYALAIELDGPLGFTLAGKPVRFGPGTYVYAGSAHGPGGIRARLARHFRMDKKLYWHVDRLTVTASAIMALAVEGGSECGIVVRLGVSSRFAPALAGFGSSDCRVCDTHLLRWLGGDS